MGQLGASNVALERERTRLLKESDETREAVAQTAQDTRRLKKELDEATFAQQKLQQELDEQAKATAAALADKDRLERRNAAQRRELQVLRSMACSECKLRAGEADGVANSLLKSRGTGLVSPAPFLGGSVHEVK